jgi:small-conductance mechanosensitive channel
MSALQKTAAASLMVLLLVAGYGLWATRERAVPAAAAANGTTPLVDQSLLVTAQQLARQASTAEEQVIARSVLQAADHELDLAFMGALHEIEANPPALTPEAQKIQERLDNAQKQLARDTDVLQTLAAQMGKASEAEKPNLQDQLDLVGSQIEIEKDEIDEANDDLLAAGGNVHQRIQKAQEEHETAERNLPAAAAPATALSSLHGMVAQFRQWLALHSKRVALERARRAAAAGAAKLTSERQAIVDDLVRVKDRLTALGAHVPTGMVDWALGTSAVQPDAGKLTARGGQAASAAASASGAPQQGESILSLTRQLAIDQRRLIVRDQRIVARNKLADLYGKWDQLVAAQQRVVLGQWLVGAAIVLIALLLLLFADGWLNRLLGRARIDRRQLATLRGVIGVCLQVVAVLIIFFTLVGIPGQWGTMLGLAGAGLTVALKDFIVGFIGWFVLMGRNGIRVGDWVEINGVSGEVVELSMFHTVLLETGNWTDAGHPTGRRVTFTNSYAIEGHYFNFSTSGQWLWDELSVVVPFGRDAHAVADAIQKEVASATADSAREAEQEWQRVSRGVRGSSLTVQPGIAMRPSAGGVEVVVRYVTRAADRYALRSRLYQSAVQLLAQPSATRAAG